MASERWLDQPPSIEAFLFAGEIILIGILLGMVIGSW